MLLKLIKAWRIKRQLQALKELNKSIRYWEHLIDKSNQCPLHCYDMQSRLASERDERAEKLRLLLKN